MALWGHEVRTWVGAARLFLDLFVASDIDTDRLEYAEVWQRGREVRAGLAEALATVTAVVFAVGEGEGSAATHADIRVNPFGRLGFREPSCQLTENRR